MEFCLSKRHVTETYVAKWGFKRNIQIITSSLQTYTHHFMESIANRRHLPMKLNEEELHAVDAIWDEVVQISAKFKPVLMHASSLCCNNQTGIYCSNLQAVWSILRNKVTPCAKHFFTRGSSTNYDQPCLLTDFHKLHHAGLFKASTEAVTLSIMRCVGDWPFSSLLTSRLPVVELEHQVVKCLNEAARLIQYGFVDSHTRESSQFECNACRDSSIRQIVKFRLIAHAMICSMTGFLLSVNWHRLAVMQHRWGQSSSPVAGIKKKLAFQDKSKFRRCQHQQREICKTYANTSLLFHLVSVVSTELIRHPDNWCLSSPFLTQWISTMSRLPDSKFRGLDRVWDFKQNPCPLTCACHLSIIHHLEQNTP